MEGCSWNRLQSPFRRTLTLTSLGWLPQVLPPPTPPADSGWSSVRGERQLLSSPLDICKSCDGELPVSPWMMTTLFSSGVKISVALWSSSPSVTEDASPPFLRAAACTPTALGGWWWWCSIDVTVATRPPPPVPGVCGAEEMENRRIDLREKSETGVQHFCTT